MSASQSLGIGSVSINVNAIANGNGQVSGSVSNNNTSAPSNAADGHSRLRASAGGTAIAAGATSARGGSEYHGKNGGYTYNPYGKTYQSNEDHEAVRKTARDFSLPDYTMRSISRLTRWSIDSVRLAITDKVGSINDFLQFARSDPYGAVRFSFQYVKGGILSPITIVILIWMAVLYWGEVLVFESSIAECRWDGWENWPIEANPHHVAFVADPQLVDPHTYPGRPWPLSTLTVEHTDLYLRRAYSRVQINLNPDTIFFLGDLFDGGREWAVEDYKSPESRYQQYGELFWQKEFERFSGIFLREYSDDEDPERNRRDGRRIIASLPGNHDLGFGKGINRQVRGRFQAYFGDGNRLDVIGNHTFVSLDTVSLSAQEQSGGLEDVYRPTADFLKNMNETKHLALERYLEHLHASSEHTLPDDNSLLKREVLDLQDKNIKIEAPEPPPRKSSTSNQAISADSMHMPTILLTHVPLYRPPGTPCGPLRERHPPMNDPPTFPDPGNAISITAGYQYQNTLSPPMTSTILSVLGRDLTTVFSGDDHDYCDVEHDSPLSLLTIKVGHEVPPIREITVKSISWAMGVRKPGFVLASLWNPIDEKGRRIDGLSTQASRGSRESDEHNYHPRTLQTHLCLLPDQLAIFIRYALFFGFTLVLLLLVAADKQQRQRRQTSEGSPLLPRAHVHGNKSAGSVSGFGILNGGAMTQLRRKKSDGDRAINGNGLPHEKHNNSSRSSGDASWRWKDRRKNSQLRVQRRGLFREWFASLWLTAKWVLLWYFILVEW